MDCDEYPTTIAIDESEAEERERYERVWEILESFRTAKCAIAIVLFYLTLCEN